MATARSTAAPRRASHVTGRRGGIRWDRLGRVGLLAMLATILALYISPAKHWFEQRQTAASQSQELSELEAENATLEQRARELRDPDTLEREARRLGMVMQGERSYVIEHGK